MDGTSASGDAARKAADDYVRLARKVGLTRAEALRLVEELWD
jgi:hypothetical protein